VTFSAKVGSSSTQRLYQSSAGGLVIDSYGISGPDAADFTYSDTCPVGSVLPAGFQCGVTITFTPSAHGQRSALLTIISHGIDQLGDVFPNPLSPELIPLIGNQQSAPGQSGGTPPSGGGIPGQSKWVTITYLDRSYQCNEFGTAHWTYYYVRLTNVSAEPLDQVSVQGEIGVRDLYQVDPPQYLLPGQKAVVLLRTVDAAPGCQIPPCVPVPGRWEDPPTQIHILYQPVIHPCQNPSPYPCVEEQQLRVPLCEGERNNPH
jgi:hypothetical protein